MSLTGEQEDLCYRIAGLIGIPRVHVGLPQAMPTGYVGWSDAKAFSSYDHICERLRDIPEELRQRLLKQGITSIGCNYAVYPLGISDAGEGGAILFGSKPIRLNLETQVLSAGHRPHDEKPTKTI